MRVSQALEAAGALDSDVAGAMLSDLTLAVGVTAGDGAVRAVAPAGEEVELRLGRTDSTAAWTVVPADR